MSESRRPTAFGQIFAPRRDWLALAPAEPILEPDLEIVDTHHHFWDLPRRRYLLDELLADLSGGHNVVATVYVECQSMYRADGPESFRSIGEVEFAAGIAAMSESGREC
jgi:predicted TIM-barrel fold metal-dependent hydrolase